MTPERADEGRRTEAPDDPCVWLIRFSEAGVPDELFAGAGATEAAHRRFDCVRTGYDVHLFVRVAHG